jgi:TIR domain
MKEKKSVFVSFAEEDVRQRNALRDHPLLKNAAFTLVDFAIKEPHNHHWQDRVQLSIRRSHGVIVLVSSNSLESSGQKWEISCAKAEKRKTYPIWAYSNDRTRIRGLSTLVWSWEGIEAFINSL